MFSSQQFRVKGVEVVRLPSWSLDDLQALEDNAEVWIDSCRPPELVTLAEKYNLVGGSPRFIFEYDLDAGLAYLQAGIKSLSPETKRAVLFGQIDEANPQNSGRLVHYFLTEDPEGRVFCLCLEMGLRPAQELGGVGRLSTIISALQSPSPSDRGLGVRGIGIAKSSDAGSNPNDPPYGRRKRKPSLLVSAPHENVLSSRLLQKQSVNRAFWRRNP